jgi:succinyl-CoA synthetase beta subunit
VPTARVEAAVEVIAEFYLAAGFMDGGSLPEIALSAQGGSGIEERTDTLHRLSVDPLLGLRPFHIRRLLSEASVEENLRNAVISAVEACYELVAKHDVTLVEINPLGVTATGTVALDARCTLDDHAAYRHSHWRSLRCVRDYERSIEGMLALAGIAFVPLDGEIGVIGLGAGLTMHLADWLTNLGGRPAFFFDATAAAVRDHAPLFANEPARQFTDALQFGLGKVGHRVGVLLANFTSGGTPVNGLAEALLVALKDIGWKGELVLHVAGYRQAEAVSFLRSAGIEPAVSLGAAVRAALERGRSV